MVLFKKNHNKLESIKETSFDLEKKIQKITEDNLETIFNLEFVRTEFQLGRFRIDTLAFDKESSSFVIIEYKNGKDSGLFEQGLAYLEIMLDRGSDFITEYNEQLNKNLKKKEVDWSQSKIIFIAPSFNKNQIQASNLDLHIELWEFHLYENDIVEFSPIRSDNAKNLTKISATSGTLGKISKEIKTYTEEYHLEKLASKKTRELYEEIKKRTMLFGDNIQVICRKHYIAFKTNYNFVYLNLKKDVIHVDLSLNPKEIQDPKHLIRSMVGIGHHSAGASRITIKDQSEIPYLMGLMEQSYSKSIQ
jgi:predicted transport protein